MSDNPQVSSAGCLRAFPLSHRREVSRYRNDPMNESPAPVVSATVTGSALVSALAFGV